eukprot:1904992-Prorocentrum_lima.AAC.1
MPWKSRIRAQGHNRYTKVLGVRQDYRRGSGSWCRCGFPTACAPADPGFELQVHLYAVPSI